jgi:TonB family protein
MTLTAADNGSDTLLGLRPPSPRLPRRRRGSWRGAAAVHLLALAVVAVVAGPSRPAPPDARVNVPKTRLAWVSVREVPRWGAGRAGGGGGGGDGRRAPAAPRDPAVAPRAAHVDPAPLTAQPLTAMAFHADVPSIAAVDASAVSAPAFSAGSAGDGHGEGTGGGYGTGHGSGVGAGAGAGIGPGAGDGSGGGVYRPGGAVTAPIVITQVLPKYPEDAVQFRAQGSVALQAIVRRNGIPDDIRVVKPIDRGPLDREAVRAVEQWRFQPGTRHGVPVDVLVTIIVDFVLY